MSENSRPEHPDQHAIDDWFLNGPKQQQIEPLVRELTLSQGLRLAEVKRVVVCALREKLKSSQEGP